MSLLRDVLGKKTARIRMAERDSDLKIVLVIEPGRLEWQGILLLSSLVAFGRGSFSVHCFCRSANMGRLNRRTRGFLKEYGIPLHGIENDFSPEYPHGNKIIACEAMAAEGGRILFLDTDVFLSRPVDLTALLPRGLGAVAAGMPPPGGEEHWPAMYARFDLPVPFQRNVALMTARVMMPYYNAGFVIFDADSGFAQAWRDCARGLDAMDLPHKRPWLDQLALPVAAARLGLEVEELPHRMNYNMNNAKAVMPPDRVFLHYHRAHCITGHQYMRNLLNNLLPQTSKFPNLRALFEHYDGIAEAYGENAS